MAYVKKPDDKEVKLYTTKIMNPHGELCLAVTGTDGWRNHTRIYREPPKFDFGDIREL